MASRDSRLAEKRLNPVTNRKNASISNSFTDRSIRQKCMAEIAFPKRNFSGQGGFLFTT